MSIEITILVKMTDFVYRVNSDGACPKAAKSFFRSAQDILQDIKHERDANGTVQRALTQLELAYRLIYDQNEKIFGKNYYDLQNELCFYIALSHKALGDSNTLIKKWIIDKTTKYGSYSFADKSDFINLIGKDDYKYKLLEKINYDPYDDISDYERFASRIG